MINNVVVGDVHAEFGKLNSFLAEKRPKNVFSVGDFGIWAPFDQDLYNRYIQLNGDGDEEAARKYAQTSLWTDKIKIPEGTDIWVTPGNHEQWTLFKEWEEKHGKDKPIEIRPHLYYCPRGSTHTLEDGRKILFMGGADSIDKQWRTPGYDWFPEEIITQKDIYNLPDTKIDILISHTCPESIVKHMFKLGQYIASDPSRLALEYVYNKYRPKQMFFGHFHVWKKGAISIGNHWTCLNQIGETGWWEKF